MPFGPGGKPSNIGNKRRKQQANIRNARKARKGKRSALDMELDRQQIMKMVAKKMSIYSIAQIMGTSTTQVYRDIQYCRQKAVDDMTQDAKQLIADELNTLAYVQREAAEAWERSQQDAESIETTKSVADALKGKNPLAKVPGTQQLQNPPTKARETTTIKKEGQVGDPRFLQLVKDVSGMRQKLLGIDQPKPAEEPDQFKTQEEVRSTIISRISQLQQVNQPVVQAQVDPNKPTVQ